MKLSRRRFLTFTGTTAAGSAALGGSLIFNPAHAQEGSQQPGKVNLDYPVTTLNNAADLKVGQPVRFNYPDDASPCMLVKTGRETRGGRWVPTGISLPTAFCARTWAVPCPIQPSSGPSNAPVTSSVFDAELNGQMVSGQATVNLPESC